MVMVLLRASMMQEETAGAAVAEPKRSIEMQLEMVVALGAALRVAVMVFVSRVVRSTADVMYETWMVGTVSMAAARDIDAAAVASRLMEAPAKTR